MMLLCLLAAGCGGAEQEESAAEQARRPFQEAAGCTMEAEVTWSGEQEDVLRYTLRCDYVPDGASTVEILAPETAAGIQATVEGNSLQLTYAGDCLDADVAGREGVSPATGLPLVLEALRSGWLLEENREKLDDVPCLRLGLDRTGSDGGKILTAVWLAQDTGTPVYAEISVDEEIILNVRFTKFDFRAILGDSKAGDAE
jgi:hypothetical protein